VEWSGVEWSEMEWNGNFHANCTNSQNSSVRIAPLAIMTEWINVLQQWAWCGAKEKKKHAAWR